MLGFNEVTAQAWPAAKKSRFFDCFTKNLQAKIFKNFIFDGYDADSVCSMTVLAGIDLLYLSKGERSLIINLKNLYD